MFKPVILLLFFICLNYSKSATDPELANVKCVDNSKIKKACAILTFDAEGNPVYQFIKKHKCKKDKKCLAVNGVTECKNGNCYASFKTCQDVIEPKNKGGDCNYHEECKSQLCQNHKCANSVSQENESCVNSYSCINGSYYCNSDYTCKKLKSPNASCVPGDMCEFGYICNGTCIGIGNLTEYEYTNYPELCKTGIIKDKQCQKKSGKTEMFNSYLDLFHNTDKTSILKDENFRLTSENMFHLENSVLKTAYYKYENYENLMNFQVMDSNGTANSSKTCEYNVLFNKNYDNGKYIIVPLTFISLLFLLFF